jgi:hypothetical protein
MIIDFKEVRGLIPGWIFNEYGQLTGNYVHADEIVCIAEHGRFQIWLNQDAYDQKDPDGLICDYDEKILRATGEREE